MDSYDDKRQMRKCGDLFHVVTMRYPISIQLGFFNRKKHQEIKKKREALQELTENTDDNNIVASTEQLDVKS